jgi:hypothetical protein
MNNTVENIQEEKLTYSELRHIADKIATEIRKEIHDFYVNAGVEFGRIYVMIGADFGEISDAVGSRIYGLVQSGEISEENSYELFDEFFKEEIEQINEEYCVYNSGKIETPKYIVIFTPLECLGDNCVAGLTAEIEFKDKITDIDISNIAQLIITVFRL